MLLRAQALFKLSNFVRAAELYA
jgi:hypothetical protein